MSAPTLTSRLTAALADDRSGATGVVRQVIDGLLELADDRDGLRAMADLVAARLPWCAPMWHVARAAYATRPALAQPAGTGGVVGLAGADAVGPIAVLNIAGTRDLAGAVPTIIVATSVKLVPQEAFGRLGAPGFEQVALGLFEAVVLDGEVVSPAEVGRRATALG